ncbi:TPA: hypothetical protein L5U90_003197 [Pseudomonas aeruginosa]|nr:hypothetical protein [Pseudomonas aeruginosa]
MFNSSMRGLNRSRNALRIGFATTTLYAILCHTAFATSILPDDPRLQPAKIRSIDNDGFSQVFIDGYIHNPTVAAFQRTVSNGQDFGIVYMNSAGGDLVAAQKLGRAIRAKGYATQIGRLSSDGKTISTGICESACPIAFVGGKYRLLDSGTGKLAVHRFYLANQGNWANDSKLLFTAERDLSRYLDEMGISNEFFELIMKTPADKLSQIGRHASYDWGLASAYSKSVWDTDSNGSIRGLSESPTGTLSIIFTCEPGMGITTRVQVNPWFPAIALLNYDAQSISVDGSKYPVDEVQVSLGDSAGHLSFTFVPSSNAVEALRQAKRVGYSWSYEQGPGEYYRTVEVPDRYIQLSELISSCPRP